jgi:hypothetical protein
MHSTGLQFDVFSVAGQYLSVHLDVYRSIFFQKNTFWKFDLLLKFSGVQCGVCKECRLLGYDTVWRF